MLVIIIRNRGATRFCHVYLHLQRADRHTSDWKLLKKAVARPKTYSLWHQTNAGVAWKPCQILDSKRRSCPQPRRVNSPLTLGFANLFQIVLQAGFFNQPCWVSSQSICSSVSSRIFMKMSRVTKSASASHNAMAFRHDWFRFQPTGQLEHLYILPDASRDPVNWAVLRIKTRLM